MIRRVDLDNTDDCPLGHRCESCGAAGVKLKTGEACRGTLAAGALSNGSATATAG